MKKILLILFTTVLFLSGCAMQKSDSNDAEALIDCIAESYASVDFSSDFKQGDTDSYDFYKDRYLELINCEEKINTKDGGEKYFLDEYIEMNCSEEYDKLKYKYLIFDMDEDDLPELCILNDSLFTYIIKYSPDSEEFELWHEISHSYIRILGSRKLFLYSMTSPIKYAFYQLDESGDIDFTVRFYIDPKNENETEYMLTLPEYESREIDIPKYSENEPVEIDSNYYYKVSKEQWDELTGEFFKAKELSQKTIENMELSYYELFSNDDSVNQQTEIGASRRLNDRIRLIYLTLPENEKYRQFLPEYKYGREFDVKGYGKISESGMDGNIYIENDNGEKSILIENPYDELTDISIVFFIDETKFVYRVNSEWTVPAFGIYDLETNEDRLIENDRDNSYTPIAYSDGSLILIKHSIKADFFDFARLNPDTYEITDVGMPLNKEGHHIAPKISEDGKTVAYITKNDKEYTLTLFSMETEKIINEFTFQSGYDYVNYDIEFISDNMIYLYALAKADWRSLYIIDISESPVSTGWQGAYRQKLLEFMESDDYLEHSAFSICDISGDGVPELIISQDTSHNASCFVYGYNGEAVLIENVKGGYGTIGYYKDNNTVMVYDLAQGYEFEGFYKVLDNKLVLEDKFFNDCGAAEPGTEVYEHNDLRVSLEEYNEALKICKGGDFVELGADYGFDEINKAFAEFKETNK